MDSNKYFSELIRTLADDLSQHNPHNNSRLVSIEKYKLQELFGYLSTKLNITMTELSEQIGLSRRTTSRILTYSDDEMVVSLRSETLRMITSYAYKVADMYETAPY